MTFPHRSRLFVFCWCIGLLSSAGAPSLLVAADDPHKAAVYSLQAHMPKGTNLARADRESLAHAVLQATRDHRDQAPAILSAALDGSTTQASGRAKRIKRPCGDVARIFQASLIAAPEQASALSEVAMALYPDCADELSKVLHTQDRSVAAYDYKDRSDYKDVADAPVAGINNARNQGDDFGLGTDFLTGFGAGFGPGFPGSPGFAGSSPSASAVIQAPLPFPLPTPSGAPVTPSANE